MDQRLQEQFDKLGASFVKLADTHAELSEALMASLSTTTKLIKDLDAIFVRDKRGDETKVPTGE